MMLFLHIINDTLDVDGLTADIGNVASINLVALVVLPFLGGLAGFFLMVSAIGNMISMMRFLQKGKPVKDLIIRQVMGGVLLLVFAMLTEGVIGYHAAVGSIFRHLNDPSAWSYQMIFYRGFHFETIHTIAWCVILNGIVQGILVKIYGHENYKKIIKAYIIGAIIVVVATPFLWDAISMAIPGYPFGTNPAWGTDWHTPDIRKANFGEIVVIFFANVIAGRPEPCFPYLAASFIGSIIGIVLSMPREKIPRKFPRIMLTIAFIMFIVGVVGLVLNIVLILEKDGFDKAIDTYTMIWSHRWYVTENGVPILGWLFQFLALNGVGLAAIMVIVRLVEFRGNGAEFAAKTTFVRRFGTLAFTIYNCQFLYFFAQWAVNSLIGFSPNPYQRGGWGGTFLILLLTFAIFHIILYSWEKVNYIGSIEWMIGTIAAHLIPGRKSEKPWYRKGEIDVKNAFYNAEWLNVVEKEEINHKKMEESKLVANLAGWGFLFPPLSLVCLPLSIKAQKKEKVNKFNVRGKAISIIGIVFLISWVTFMSIFTLNDLGISLF